MSAQELNVVLTHSAFPSMTIYIPSVTHRLPEVLLATQQFGGPDAGNLAGFLPIADCRSGKLITGYEEASGYSHLCRLPPVLIWWPLPSAEGWREGSTLQGK